MTKYIPKNTSPLMAYLTVRDADAMSAFYQKAFGFTQMERLEGEDGKPIHIGMSFQDRAVVMFSPAPSTPDMDWESPAHSGTASPIGLYLYCPDVDALFKQALAAGATESSALQDMFWGDRMCQVKDPDGYRWSFATYTGKTSPAP